MSKLFSCSRLDQLTNQPCSFSSSRKWNLSRHIKTQHTAVTQETVSCNRLLASSKATLSSASSQPTFAFAGASVDAVTTRDLVAKPPTALLEWGTLQEVHQSYIAPLASTTTASQSLSPILAPIVQQSYAAPLASTTATSQSLSTSLAPTGQPIYKHTQAPIPISLQDTYRLGEKYESLFKSFQRLGVEIFKFENAVKKTSRSKSPLRNNT